MNSQADPFDLTGRRALITGASRGIGLAIADALSRRGADLAITGRKTDALEAAAQQLRSNGVAVTALACNQGEAAGIVGLFEQLDRLAFVPDIAIVNAATNPVLGPLIDIELNAWNKILTVNLTGALLTAQNAIHRMLPTKRGSVLFIASTSGIDPLPGLGAYSVSKAGLLGLTRALAKELGPTGIRVNALAPGLVETRFAAALFQDRQLYEHLIAQIPLGRHGQPADIASAAVFLSSDAAAHITGQVLIIDGGERV
jgi:NAD(P)-dependent dehydrogenase (short-subunit alcohol dehydrogenase family)